jgi:hypothetical protein
MSQVKPVYSVAEVARMMGLSHNQTLRRLQAAGVIEPKGRGVKNDVLLSSLRERMPGYWGSAVEAARLGR